MKNPLEKYQAVKMLFIHGNRYATEPELARWGRAAGLTADEILADVRENDPSGEHDAGIRRMWDGTTFRPSDERSPYSYRPRTSYAPRMARHTLPGYVRDLIHDGGGEADFDALRAISPIPVAGMTPQTQTAAYLVALYEPFDSLFIFANIKDGHPRGEIGRNILTRDEWLERMRRTGNLGGDCIGKNPLTGRQGTTSDGRPSFTSLDCVAAYRYALIEFDHLPIKKQCAFWRGWLADPERAAAVAALVFSGNKSIHGLVRTGADEITAPKVERDLRDLLCADPEEKTIVEDGKQKLVYPYRADHNTLKPHGGTRLAGAMRRPSGNKQELLYLAPLHNERG